MSEELNDVVSENPLEVTVGTRDKELPVSPLVQAIKSEGAWLNHDEDIYRGFDLTASEITAEVSEETGNIEVTIKPNEEQLEKFPEILVSIDGKWYDKGILENAIVLAPAVGHRIVIDWSVDEKEVFKVLPVTPQSINLPAKEEEKSTEESVEDTSSEEPKTTIEDASIAGEF
jgi:hypothetical protein